MSTRAIRTSSVDGACDVCGRTLLRGEHAEIYLDGATRHSVCELCTSRALHGGWVREGTMPEYGDANSRVDRRRSLLGRWRKGRDPAPAAAPEDEYVDEEYEPRPPPPRQERPPAARPLAPRPEPAYEDDSRSRSGTGGGRSRSRRRSRASTGDGGRGVPSGGREPRHVRAVPTSIEHRIASAVSLFNDSEHPRTVAGIARSLGLPDVSVHPADAGGSMVRVVVSWELCWYRYEVDLSDEVPSVRKGGQGYELDELSALEREINAVADERGVLRFA